jgi:hypothetical protein
MQSKGVYYVAAAIGSIIGSLIPLLWGAGFLSLSSLLMSTIFAVAAIILVYKFF